MEPRRLPLSWVGYADDAAFVATSRDAADTMVSETVQELKASGPDGGCGEDALDEFPTKGTLLSASGRRAGNVGIGLELCLILGELGRKREIRCRVARASGRRMLCLLLRVQRKKTRKEE